MSKELVKNIGLGLAALLVVCNTVTIHGMKKHSKKTKGAFSGMRARMGEASKMQRPEVGPRMGSRSSEGRGSWRQEQPSKERGPKKGKGDK